MILKDYQISNLHGYLTVDLTFNADLSIILGGNGEGKTSALNLLSHILRFNLTEIANVPFERAEIAYAETKDGPICNLEVSKKDEQISFKFTRGSTTKSAAISALEKNDLLPTASFFHNKLLFMGESPILEGRSNQKNAKILREIESAVTSSAHLTFVKLDRTITALDPTGSLSRETLFEDQKPSRSDRKTAKDPLSVVGNVISEKYLEYRNKAEEINLAAQQDSFDLHFEIGSEVSTKAKDLENLDAALTRLETAWEVSAFAEKIREKKFEDFIKRLSSLCSEAKSVLQEKKKGRRTAAEEAKLIIAGEYSRKVESLASLLEAQNNEVANALSELAQYIDAANSFLEDSGKRLFLSSVDNTLYFKRAQKNEKVAYTDAVKGSPLSGLSSGERQILILLTYLAFSTEVSESSIFLVDEPELSLHLRWQAKLIPAMQKLSPGGCQIIMATHAPEIAGRARDKCMPVNKNRNRRNHQQ